MSENRIGNGMYENPLKVNKVTVINPDFIRVIRAWDTRYICTVHRIQQTVALWKVNNSMKYSKGKTIVENFGFSFVFPPKNILYLNPAPSPPIHHPTDTLLTHNAITLCNTIESNKIHPVQIPWPNLVCFTHLPHRWKKRKRTSKHRNHRSLIFRYLNHPPFVCSYCSRR